jgi:hypothetical protein
VSTGRAKPEPPAPGPTEGISLVGLWGKRWPWVTTGPMPKNLTSALETKAMGLGLITSQSEKSSSDFLGRVNLVSQPLCAQFPACNVRATHPLQVTGVAVWLHCNSCHIERHPVPG